MTAAVDDETALEEVLAWLERPPQPGTPEDERFGDRLRQVLAASLPRDDMSDDDDPEAPAPLPLDADLRGRLEALARRRTQANPFGENRDGLGPTLGMDVSRS
ncbi:hypothetical protein P7B02_06915 [Caulobacter segnis]|uniref:hypothetical protein n=1 Tax=Caulobacter segnis TaxID=88688 RepID=UPI00240F8D67|nr:hypothetical protein [Caulobacter segnis]MDG2521270.1 hypothetical protein [Caulobacter segnis]